MVPAEADSAAIRAAAAASGHLRLLVGTPQEVRGVLHARDALLSPELTAGDLCRPLPTLACVTQVPEAVTVLQEARAHLGLVTAADQTVIGMVSVTDLLGELLDTRAA